MKRLSDKQIDDATNTNDKSFHCDVCNTDIKTRSGFWKHKLKHPGAQFSNGSNPTLACGICSQLFLKQTDICRHVSGVHSIPAVIHNIEFGSVDEFVSWKRIQEETGRCVFVQRSTPEPSSKGSVVRYFCHRSGKFVSKSNGIRAPRQNITNRCNFQCSAFIRSQTNRNGRVEVSCCLAHYGHDRALSRLPLPDSIRDQVKEYLLDERDPDWIIRQTKSSFPEDSIIDRAQLLNKSDINNIRKACGLPKPQKQPDNDMTDEAWEKDKRMTEIREFILSFTEWINEKMPTADLSTLDAINTKFEEIFALIKNSTSTSTSEVSRDACPTNKEVKRRRRF